MSVKNQILIYISVCAAVIFNVLTTSNMYAGETIVTNEISVTASTGGNVVSPGANITEGEKSGHVYIETTINGEVVEHIIDEEIINDSYIFVKTTESSDQNAHITTSIEVNLTEKEEVVVSEQDTHDTVSVDTGIDVLLEEEKASVNESRSLVEEFIKKIFNYVFSLFA